MQLDSVCILHNNGITRFFGLKTKARNSHNVSIIWIDSETVGPSYNWTIILLLGTNCTCQFFLGVIRWTRHSCASGFSVVEKCTINIWGTPWNRVWVLVNTLKHVMIANIVWVSFVGWHEVARVLQSPCWWTPSFSWDHCDCHPCWSITHSTGNIVVVNSCEWFMVCQILSSIHRAKPLHSRLVCKVVWIIRHAEVVGTSSSASKPASSSPSCIHQLCSSDIWAAGFSPPCVDYPTIPWARWTCYPLLSPLSLRSTRTRHTISPIPSIPPSQHLNVGKGTCVDIIPCGCTSL